MTILQATLLGAFPFVALTGAGVVFFLIRKRIFAELKDE